MQMRISAFRGVNLVNCEFALFVPRWMGMLQTFNLPDLIKLHFSSPARSHERTAEELELVFEELLHISALSHLSTSIKRELATIIVFEAHAAAGTVCKYSDCVLWL